MPRLTEKQINLLIDNMRKYPALFYDIFINPSFVRYRGYNPDLAISDPSDVHQFFKSNVAAADKSAFSKLLALNTTSDLDYRRKEQKSFIELRNQLQRLFKMQGSTTIPIWSPATQTRSEQGTISSISEQDAITNFRNFLLDEQNIEVQKLLAPLIEDTTSNNSRIIREYSKHLQELIAKRTQKPPSMASRETIKVLAPKIEEQLFRYLLDVNRGKTATGKSSDQPSAELIALRKQRNIANFSDIDISNSFASLIKLSDLETELSDPKTIRLRVLQIHIYRAINDMFEKYSDLPLKEAVKKVFEQDNSIDELIKMHKRARDYARADSRFDDIKNDNDLLKIVYRHSPKCTLKIKKKLQAASKTKVSRVGDISAAIEKNQDFMLIFLNNLNLKINQDSMTLQEAYSELQRFIDLKNPANPAYDFTKSKFIDAFADRCIVTIKHAIAYKFAKFKQSAEDIPHEISVADTQFFKGSGNDAKQHRITYLVLEMLLINSGKIPDNDSTDLASAQELYSKVKAASAAPKSIITGRGRSSPLYFSDSFMPNMQKKIADGKITFEDLVDISRMPLELRQALVTQKPLHGNKENTPRNKF